MPLEANCVIGRNWLNQYFLMEEKQIKQSERSRYRSSFGATLLFSGVQIYQILIRIIKSKFMAVLIGPVGFGISSLLRSTTDTISVITNLGLNTSSVKTIASANREGDKDLLAKHITVQRRLIWLTGIIGMLICAIFAPLWSDLSFGNSAYVWAFVAVSTIVLFDQLNKGELALLQGMQQRKKLARANIWGQTLNAIVTIPLYYIYGVDAIVASLVLGSLIALIISFSFSRKMDVGRVHLSWKETFVIGHEMVKLGFFLSLQSIMTMITIWIIRNYINSIGGLEEVGLYSAGTAIIGSYIGLVFSAISTDYFPRLASVKNNEELNLVVHTQAELTILLLAPLIVAFLVFIKPVIVFLYSDKFLPIEYMMYWAVGGVLVQAMAWAISHTLLAKAKPSYFFFNELIVTAWGLPVKLLCYNYWGLAGFGMATVIVYSLYLVQVLFLTNKLFGLLYNSSLWKLFVLLNIPVLCTVFLKYVFDESLGYLCGGSIFIITSIYSIIKLNQKLGLRTLLESRLKK